MKCKDCALYIDYWCDMVKDSPDPDMERDCAHFIQAGTEKVVCTTFWYKPKSKIIAK